MIDRNPVLALLSNAQLCRNIDESAAAIQETKTKVKKALECPFQNQDKYEANMLTRRRTFKMNLL